MKAKSLLTLPFLLISLIHLEAQILHGNTTLSGSNNMTLDVTVNTNSNEVDLIITGPNNFWYGVGFGGSIMINRYAIITTGSGGITERRLGNHNAGTLLGSSLTSQGTSVNGSVRTTTATRPRVGPNNNYFTFPASPGSFTLIWAKGVGSNLANHGGGNRGSATITLVDICNIPVTNTGDTTVCNGETVQIFGNPQNNPGIYFDTLSSALGCDSVLSFELKNLVVDTSVSVIDGDSLVAQADSASYQWIDCNTGLPIPGATNQYFVPVNAGFYAAIVTQNGCPDTSSCYFVFPFVGLSGDIFDGLTLSPNPFKNNLRIRSQNPIEKAEIKVFSNSGKVVYSKFFELLKSENISLRGLPKGAYILELSSEGNRYTTRIIK